MMAHATEYWDPRTAPRQPPPPFRDFDRPNLSFFAVGKIDNATENLGIFNVFFAGSWYEISAFERIIACLTDSRTDTAGLEPLGAPLPGEFEAAIGAFAAGIGAVRPTNATVAAARAICQAAAQQTSDTEIALDDDGALSFDLRLSDGRLVLAELCVNGRVHVGVYGENDELKEHRTAGYEYLVSVIES